MGTVPVGSGPEMAGFDSENGYVYVANAESSYVSVIDGLSPIGNISVGTDPCSVTYDSADGYVYVPNLGSSNVSVIDGTSVVGSVRVGTDPIASVYDSENQDVYVANDRTQNLSVIHGMAVVGTVPVGLAPTALAFDSANGLIYSVNSDSDNISIIDGLTVKSTITGFGAASYGAAYDAADGYVYVPDFFAEDVNLFNTTGYVATASVGTGPMSATYDSVTGDVYVPNWDDANVSIVAGNATVGGFNISGSGPYGVGVDYWNNFLYVANYLSDSVSIVAPLYETFTETGLPMESEWWLNLTNGQSFNTTQSSIEFWEPNGTYHYSLGTNESSYSATGGSFNANGFSLSKTVRFTAVTYPMTFTESGLPAGTPWWVNVTAIATASSTTNTLSFGLSNGTWEWLASAGPDYTQSHGPIRVRGAPLTTPVDFLPITFSVNFTVGGLPNGIPCWVNLSSGQSVLGAVGTFGLPVMNGSYSWTIASASKRYAPTEPSGKFTVDGSPVSLYVNFTEVEYVLTFVEAGLPSGTNWTVDLSGSTGASTSSTITFREPNGSYFMSVVAPAGYSTNFRPGELNVSGGNISQAIEFTALPTSSTPFLGLSGLEGYAILAGLIAVIAAVVGLAVIRARRKTTEFEPDPPGPFP